MSDLGLIWKGCAAAAETLAATDLVEQQRPIVRHIQQLITALQGMTAGLPDGEAALQAALPILGEAFSQRLATLHHYARLLVESPASFDGAVLPEAAQDAARYIIQLARSLEAVVERLHQQTLDQRTDARRQTPAPLDLASFLAEAVPLYRFYLREQAVQLVYRPSSAPMIVYARHYHVSELLRHIVMTLGSELVNYGTLTLHLEDEPACVAVHIGCTGTQLSRADLQTLFSIKGRHMYREQLDADAGYLTFLRQTGVSSTIVLHLPRFGSEV